MYPRKNEPFNNGLRRMESFPNRNQQPQHQQQPPPQQQYIRRGGPGGVGSYGDRFQHSNEMPLFRHPPPPLPPPPLPPPSSLPPLPPQQHLIPRDINNSFHHSSIPLPPDHSSRIGDNRNCGWNVPDSTPHQSYNNNQHVFPPNNFPNTSLPPPPLSMYPTDTSNQVRPPPPVETSVIPYSRPQQVPFVTPNPTCPPPPPLPPPPLPSSPCPPLPPPLPSAPCPPPPPPVVLSNQNNLNAKNSRNQVTPPLQSNIPVPQPAAHTSFIPPIPSTPGDTTSNVGPSPPIPSPDLLMTLPPPNFNVPPPNLSTLNDCMSIPQQSCESVCKDSEKAKDDAQRQEDQSWLNQRFLKSKYSQPKPTSNQESITISEAQKLIRDMLILAAQLQQQTKNLEFIMATASKDDWMVEVKKIESMKEQLEQFRKKVDNEDLMAQLRLKVKKREKKRERLKRSRARCFKEKQEALVQRNERHSQVDEWRDAISQKEVQFKKDKEMKICVDSVLSEVRKKKSDVSKTLELIKALGKLRKIRKENVAKKGLYTLFHSDQKFEEDISRLQRILNRQMEIYEAEQRTLMVMLECEQEETKEKERARSHKVQAEIDKRGRKREQQLLFGNRTIEEDDPLYPFMKFYSQAEDNWDAFIQIRRDWDRYLVRENTLGGTRLPNSWVMPPVPSDASWAKLLQT